MKDEKYKCGHKRRMIVIDSNALTMSEYFNWKDTVGFDGDKSLCWYCYIKRLSENK